MNRYKLLSVPEIFDYANCSHAKVTDLNAAYKFHLIKNGLTGYVGNAFSLIVSVQEAAFPKTPFELINLMNMDVLVNGNLRNNPGHAKSWEKFVAHMKENYTFASPNVDEFLESVRVSMW